MAGCSDRWFAAPAWVSGADYNVFDRPRGAAVGYIISSAYQCKRAPLTPPTCDAGAFYNLQKGACERCSASTGSQGSGQNEWKCVFDLNSQDHRSLVHNGAKIWT